MDKSRIFIPLNLHPWGLHVEDCVKRAIALTTGMDYMLVQRELNKHKKITGATVFNEKGNPRSYMENVLGFSRNKVSKNTDGKIMSVKDFANANVCGRYVVSVSGHWTACIDGKIYDTWDCTGENVLSYYEITRFHKTYVGKHSRFRVNRKNVDNISVTIYDGNGMFVTKNFSKAEGEAYIEKLYERCYLNIDEVGEYI